MLLAAPDASLAGAWTMEPGRGQVIVSGFYAEASQAFGESGDAEEIPVFHKADIQADVEYGWAEGWTVIGRGGLKTEAVGEPVTIDEARFGLVGIGSRFRLLETGASVVSAEVTGRWAAQSSGMQASGMQENGDLDLRLLAGHGFGAGPWSGFAEIQLAYRARFGDVEDELRLDATVGLRPAQSILLLAKSFNTVRPDASYREHKVQLGAVYEINEAIALEVGAIATVDGRMALREQGIVTAVWYRF